MKSKLALSLSLLFLFCSALSFGQTGAETEKKDVGMDIQPSVFQFNAGRGERVVQNISISNSQSVPVQLKFYLSDWRRDTSGGHQYFVPGTLPTSCAQWIKLSRTFVEVPAKGAVKFDVTLEMPDSAKAVEVMRWAMLFVEFVEETKAPQIGGKEIASNLVRKQRIGLHMYQIPPGMNEKELKMLSFEPVATKKNVYRIACQNTGDLQIVAKPYLELTSLEEGAKPVKIESAEFPMFPGQRRVVDITIPQETPKGKYNVIAAIDGGEDIPIEAAQSEISIN
jgi:hypothetical protein